MSAPPGGQAPARKSHPFVLAVSLIVLIASLIALVTGPTNGWWRLGFVGLMFVAAAVAIPLVPGREKVGQGLVAAATFVGLILALLPLWPSVVQSEASGTASSSTAAPPTTPTPAASSAKPKPKPTRTATPSSPTSSPADDPEPEPTRATASRTPTQRAAPAQPEVQLVNSWAGRCADVQGPTSADGNPTQLFACDDSLPQQTWVWLDTGQLKGYHGRCLTLDWTGENPPDGVPVVMRDCGDELGQRWQRDSRGFLVSDNDMCLDLVGPAKIDNTLLHGYTCDSDHYWDRWNVTEI